MATKKNVGRPEKAKSKRIKTRYIYLTDEQVRKIQGKYKKLTDAVLDKCG